VATHFPAAPDSRVRSTGLKLGETATAAAWPSQQRRSYEGAGLRVGDGRARWSRRSSRRPWTPPRSYGSLREPQLEAPPPAPRGGKLERGARRRGLPAADLAEGEIAQLVSGAADDVAGERGSW